MVCASVSLLHTRTCVIIFHAGRCASFYGKKNRVCVGFAPSHTDLRRYFSLEEDVCHFRHADRLLLWIAGLPDVPGSVRGFLGFLSSCASFRGGCAWNFLSHGRRRVDFLSGSRAALSMRGRASKFRSPRRRCVERRLSRSACGEFFTMEQAVRLIFQHTRRPVEKEKSFWS
ncbi:hypothetical protein NDU88_008628 [Pleurodeles waltl]|uniref:Secreted protein n=1 Tax=Pleurodeles waltl TaxID=8319 RepID=A0AAV7PQY0_PLEWA|nr:hypothetical protein NDU88_008628 [Pleurodeles waltl]